MSDSHAAGRARRGTAVPSAGLKGTAERGKIGASRPLTAHDLETMSIARPLFALLLSVLAGAALAQYKVVTPDGRVTYTDRPPATEGVNVTSLGRGGAASPQVAGVSLPLELRQIAARYPVTLYAGADCAPCDVGRQMLQQRGVPYAERRIVTEDDTQALERLVGGRTIPSLMIGTQALRGWSAQDWASYLDAAGYPRESRLPRGWQPPAPAPLVERVAAPLQAPGAAPATPAPAAPAAEPPAEEPAIRF